MSAALTCTHMHSHTHTHTQSITSIHLHTQSLPHASTHRLTYTGLHTHPLTQSYIHIEIFCTDIHICASMYTHTYTCVYVYIYGHNVYICIYVQNVSIQVYNLYIFIIYTMNTHIHVENHLFNKMLWDNRALQINYTSTKKKQTWNHLNKHLPCFP